MGNPDQPRDPKGSPTGGQWSSKAGGTVKFYDALHKGPDAKVVYELGFASNPKIKTKADAVNAAIKVAEAQGYRTSQMRWTVHPNVAVPKAASSLKAALNKAPTVKGGFTPFKKYDPREEARSKG